ncbi:hypothetical protein [Klebsiella quasivariicola]|uniref:hypothetical protein n=1 Tax=Klebsiella quasivariicola TaxID=2026240 RepID=UPI0024797603|nr:hypothetical protein [Klebsiella quasivariicola]
MNNDKNYLKAMIINMLPLLTEEAADIESLKVLKEAFIAGVVAGCFPSLSDEARDELEAYATVLNGKVNEYLDMAYTNYLAEQSGKAFALLVVSEA